MLSSGLIVIFRGYVLTNNKRCVEKLKNRTEFKTYEQVKNLPEFAGVLAEDIILIDIDDAETSEILHKIVVDKKLRCRIYNTSRGKHFIFKNNGEPIKSHVKQIASEVLKNGLPEGVILNVNFPKLSKEEIKGVKVCRQAKAMWQEEFDKRTNPQGKEYYWLTGKFVNLDKGTDTDEWALENGYISIVPVQFDLTAHHAMQQLNSWEL